MKSRKRWYLAAGLVAIIALAAVIFTGCAGAEGPAGTPGMDASATCTECHDDTTLISAKQAQIGQTVHQTGTAWSYAGGRASCTACHSSVGFKEMIEMGAGVEDGKDTPDASPQDCRTCHEIHTTYTKADWALTTTTPVTLVAGGATFDKGKGNLCATCHQPRREMVAENGIVNVSSTHWGPHHGPQSATMLGEVGALVDGSPGTHYMLVEDSCVTCHLSEDSHFLAPAVKACQTCHADATNFDIGGVQTEVEELIHELEGLLEKKGMYHDGHPVVGEYPEAEAGALWNYIMIEVEDGSKGVHNPKYVIDLLEASIAVLK